jgi:hypothetical protein
MLKNLILGLMSTSRNKKYFKKSLPKTVAFLFYL